MNHHISCLVRVACVALVAALVGCASPRQTVQIQSGQAARVTNESAGAQRNGQAIAVLNGAGFEKNPANVLETQWRTSIVEVDGKPIPDGTTEIELAPGKHRVTMACVFPYNSVKMDVVNFELAFEAGRRYWHSAEGEIVKQLISLDRYRAVVNSLGRPVMTCRPGLKHVALTANAGPRYGSGDLPQPYGRLK